MTKPFLEVFYTLKLNPELTDLFLGTMVEKVVSTSRKDILKIFLQSDHLISKQCVHAVEREIKNQLFQNAKMQVKIFEHFSLSSMYTAENLMDAYGDSIRMELKDYNHFDYNLFYHATIEYPDEQVMMLVIEDTMIARKRSEELQRVLDQMINSRCGLQIDIRISYKNAAESKARVNAAYKIQEQVAQIAVRAAGEETTEEKTLKTPKKAETTEIAGKRTGFQKRSQQSFKRSDHPDVIYGRDFDDETIPIDQILGEIGEVAVHGEIIRVEYRELRNEKFLVTFDITDFTDTISAKIFVQPEVKDELSEKLKKGAFIKIKGVANLDTFSKELMLGYIVGIMSIPDFTTSRMDNSPEKRVELHCHTKMSDMDGVSEVSDLIKRAKKWGHKAIAVTDHGVVQAFPDALHTLQDMNKGTDSEFKVIYGMEGYLVDDLKDIVVNPAERTLQDTFVVFDLETTGFSPFKNRIIEIGAVKVQNGEILDRFSYFVNPEVPIPFRIENLTGISDAMVQDADTIEVVLPEFLDFIGDAVLVAHNASFDMGFLEHNAFLIGMEREFASVDTVGLARVLLPNISKYTLDHVAKELKVSLENHHRAVDDAGATAEIFMHFQNMLADQNITTLQKVNELCSTSVQTVMKLPSYHVIILAKNEVGRVNLYRLVSMSHLKYYHTRPRIPKSELARLREGLIIGSACEQGELYRAILDGKPDADIARIVNFYDYLEIQPLGNNAFLLRDERSSVRTMEDIEAINQRIVDLGEQFKKPVVATCDVHFMDPEDEIYRRIIMAGKGFKDADEQAPLYFRTTEEMLAEFQYLGSDKAEEVVITNTNLICDMVEKISPVRPDKCPPVIEDSDKILTDMCYQKAHSMYGDNLPPQVSERLEKELHSIISNGFAVMYMIAQKLVHKSNEDGYLVGSRGSVGSSFVATMSGITEVNPLSPHYYCSKCHYSDFTSDEVRAYSGRAGCDMPDKKCPECGEMLKKDGFDIPFETFLGFKGDKEPDIDLNFSGDYQAKAHKYTEVIFGEGHTFKAGTIGTLADKTAYGYVQKYYEERGVKKRSCEINRITVGCTGVRRTTGQHPGGIIVLPHGEEIDTFTPVQHPANDMKSDIITTHFDYHSIDHNLLKLDILGHDDPTMIRMLQDLTGTDPTQVPLDDQKVMSLFMNTEALGIKPSDIGGCPLGSLGVPEFGTDFVIQMLLDAQPKSFSDLIRISGLGHGTDVWLGNAQDLIKSGTCTISTAICCRDDIMVYLIHMGVEPSTAFSIMENVRKGKVAKHKCDKWEDWKADMAAHNVPDWYIGSCEKIMYMFPKAHAAAYVMMAWRIAYYKINYPLAYYSAFFSIRATGFNYDIMCQGRDRLEYYMEDYKRREDTLTPKEQGTMKDMKIAQEMYARGYEFTPIDIFSVDARKCRIVDNKIMPPLTSIDGMGENAADAVVEAVKGGPFLSKEDFYQRSKVSMTVVDYMYNLGLLGDIPEKNQISLFDFA